VPDAASEPNEAELLATPASLNNPITGYIASSDDVDWYEFEVPQDGTLALDLVSSGPTAVDFGLRLWDDESNSLAGDVVRGSDVASELHLSAAVTAGTYRVQLWESDDNAWDLEVSYELTLSLQ
jgi:hypothetical protein